MGVKDVGSDHQDQPVVLPADGAVEDGLAEPSLAKVVLRGGGQQQDALHHAQALVQQVLEQLRLLEAADAPALQRLVPRGDRRDQHVVEAALEDDRAQVGALRVGRRVEHVGVLQDAVDDLQQDGPHLPSLRDLREHAPREADQDVGAQVHEGGFQRVFEVDHVVGVVHQRAALRHHRAVVGQERRLLLAAHEEVGV